MNRKAELITIGQGLAHKGQQLTETDRGRLPEEPGGRVLGQRQQGQPQRHPAADESPPPEPLVVGSHVGRHQRQPVTNEQGNQGVRPGEKAL